MRDAATLQAIRTYLGLTQTDLGVWLGLGRAQIASIETGREPLPRHARPWLRAGAAVLTQPDDAAGPAPAPYPGLPPVPAAGPAAVLARLHRQHQALVLAHHLAARRLAAGPLLLAALPPPPADPGATPEPAALGLRRRWLARLLEAAADALLPAAPAGPVAAVLLAVRVEAWQHEAARLHTWLGATGTPEPA